MDRSGRKKISYNIVEINNIINQLRIMDTYRLLYTTIEYIFFSSLHGTFTKINHVLGLKTHFKKLSRIEIIQCLLKNPTIAEKSQNTQR